MNMNKKFRFLKYLLIPVTLAIFYLLAYYGIYLSILGYVFMFSVGWFWIIVGYGILIGIAYSISIGIPNLLRMLIIYFYGFSWFIIIIHALAGLVGLINVFSLLYSNPPLIEPGSVFFLKGMWNQAPLKTLFVGLPFVFIFLGTVGSTIILPFAIKDIDD